jgi:hypothetical protein
VNAYHVCGIVFAIWAVVVSFLGITRENFPGTDTAARVVALVSLVLMLLTVGSAIYTGVAEEEDHPEGQDSALVLPI